MSPAPFDPDRPLDHGARQPEAAPPADGQPPVADPVPQPGPGSAAAWPGPGQFAGGPGSAPPYGFGPWSVPDPPPRERRPGRALGVGVVAVLVIMLLGLPFGLLWRAVAPSVPVLKTEEGAVLVQPEPEQFIAADGWFSLFGLGFGVLVAVAAWMALRRYRGPVVLAVVVLGSLGAAVLAWRLGRAIGLDEYRHLLAAAPPGETFSRPPDLRAGRFAWLYGVVPTLRGALLVPAFGAAVTYTLLAGWSRYPDLRPEPEPALSWDSATPQTPPAAPAPPAPGAAEPPHD